MDPFVAALFLYGFYCAVRDMGRAMSRDTAQVRARTPRRGNDRVAQRRAASRAVMGFWGREARHGFPVARHGFTNGWRDHQVAMARRERDSTRHAADSAHLLNKLRAETAAHHHRLATAQREREHPPTMSDQLAAEPVTGRAEQAGGDPPAAGNGHPASQPAASGNGHGQQPGLATTGGSGMTTGTDFNYQQTITTAESLEGLADHAVNNELLDQATQMADALGQMVPTDADTNGKAGDVAAAAQAVKEAYARLTDAASALKTRVEQTYGQVQEAKDASGEELPQPEFVQS
jgi:hypothetical protein